MHRIVWVMVTLAVGVLLGFLSLARSGEHVGAKICYVPFGVETYVPMRESNIHAHCSYSGELDIASQKYSDVTSLIKKSSPGTFEDGMVRVKISVAGADNIFIDNHGGVKIGESQFQLDSFSLMRVKKIIESVTHPTPPPSK